MKVITTGKSYNVKPNQVIGLSKWLPGQYSLERTWDPDKLSEAISGAVQACDPKKMVESDVKANHEESKDSPHKPESNLKQVGGALNENAINSSLETLITFDTPANATVLMPEVNVTNLPPGVMNNAAGSLADTSVGIGNNTNNNAINLSEEDINETIEFPQSKSPTTDLTPANELAAETLQDASKVIVNHCATEDSLNDIWSHKTWRIRIHVTLDALYLTLKSDKGKTYSETMDWHNGLFSLKSIGFTQDWISLTAMHQDTQSKFGTPVNYWIKPIPEELS
ncbi:hypothetical protein DSO57_1028246 [Entomophthora muscae]|uniref:Uncharacterized protein n=1 Tax=Entomophthora muscae TaxID=34485 RepID=A0ACC2UB88_9FUNG|nr:hypothetical protein DSO57_1028246 [Entomophthora muscae]